MINRSSSASSFARKRLWILFLVIFSCAATFIASLFIGRYLITPYEVIRTIVAFFLDGNIDSQESSIILGLRLPRTILSFLIGGGLAVSGATYQSLFRNQLVSPDILGVSSGAGFGAALSILLVGSSIINPLFSIGFGILSVLITFRLATIKKETSILSLVLAGIVISSIFSSLISLIKFTADPYDELPAITYWLMGSFSKISYEEVKLASVPILISVFSLHLMRWRLNVLSLGDEEVLSLGINPHKTRIFMIFLSTVITSISVTVVGVVGWVGLVIPHISRFLFGADNRTVLPSSFIIGGIFLTWVDILSRSISAAEIPIGILTSLMGAPFFAVLFKKLQKERRIW